MATNAQVSLAQVRYRAPKGIGEQVIQSNRALMTLSDYIGDLRGVTVKNLPTAVVSFLSVTGREGLCYVDESAFGAAYFSFSEGIFHEGKQIGLYKDEEGDVAVYEWSRTMFACAIDDWSNHRRRGTVYVRGDNYKELKRALAHFVFKHFRICE